MGEETLPTLTVYILLVLVASTRWQDWRSLELKARPAAGFIAALLSTLALPWSGVALSTLFGVNSVFWFPAIALALIFSVAPEKKQYLLSLSLIIDLCAILLTIYVVVDQIGIVGDYMSLESLSALYQLESLGNYKLYLGAASIGLGLLLALNPIICESGLNQGLVGFSVFGFVVSTLLPTNYLALAMSIAPEVFLPYDIVAKLVLAAAVSRLLCSRSYLRVTAAFTRKIQVAAQILVWAGCILTIAGI